MALQNVAVIRLLQDRLLLVEDPDGLRGSILAALHSHLLGSPSSQFGGVPGLQTVSQVSTPLHASPSAHSASSLHT